MHDLAIEVKTGLSNSNIFLECWQLLKNSIESLVCFVHSHDIGYENNHSSFSK